MVRQRACGVAVGLEDGIGDCAVVFRRAGLGDGQSRGWICAGQEGCVDS